MLTLLNRSHKDFLLASRLNFSKWRLVDIDNYMGGNKPFNAATEQDQRDWQKKVDEFIETVDNPKEATAAQVRVLEAQTEESLQWLKIREPNSNSRIPVEDTLYQAELDAAAKLEAEAKAAQESEKKKGKKSKKKAEASE